MATPRGKYELKGRPHDQQRPIGTEKKDEFDVFRQKLDGNYESEDSISKCERKWERAKMLRLQ
jgi:hypothetical protein